MQDLDITFIERVYTRDLIPSSISHTCYVYLALIQGHKMNKRVAKSSINDVPGSMRETNPKFIDLTLVANPVNRGY